MKKAILFGASGYIGSHLVQDLLNNEAYEQVIIVVRKDLNIQHPKLKTVLGDFNALQNLKAELVADDVFITLGTTKKKTPDLKAYYQVDHDYPVLAAKIAKENGAKSVFMVTAIGANSSSKIFYSRTKGDVERDVIALDFDHTHIFQPSMILANRKENRTGEQIFMSIFRVINPLFVGGISKYKGIEGKDVAKAMNNAAMNQTTKVKVYQWKEINELL
jgi:uncharacterized protein YbjT (DUF2867 family)